ncbi:MAG: DUF2752 domain-containing protein [Bacteroidaceae bacterium]|nr:DUF2752 domain-containing protein [Bacteroidaceae bacterium]MBQ2289187.1 DUF2752 domain-containing protein [Bacteroidaceae bacterium]
MQKATVLQCIKLLLLLIVPVVLYMIPADGINNGETICIYTRIFGVECWGCGITRAIFSVLYLRFAEAWEYNSLVVIVFPLLLFEWLRSVIRLWRQIQKER